jgi:hypothetical protein
MWLAIRLSVFLLAMLVRMYGRMRLPPSHGSIEGRALYRRIRRKPKSKGIAGFGLGIEMSAGMVFRMHREGRADRWFKVLGLSREVQTGDGAFDCLVYVACDHEGLHELLREHAAARAAIRAVFEAGYAGIRHDGRVLWIARDAGVEPTDADEALLAALDRSLRSLDSRVWARSNPFALRVLGCEAVSWGIAGFALASLPPAVLSLDASLTAGALLGYGAAVGAGGIAIAGLAVVALLRGSSRARLVMLECGVLLLLSMPVVGIQTIADINAETGQVTAESARREVVGKEVRVRGAGRRRRTQHLLTLAVGAPVGGYAIPTTVTVGSSLYSEVGVGDQLRVTVSTGSLGLAWVEYGPVAATP